MRAEQACRDRARLLATAARLLDAIGQPASGFVVRIEVDGRRDVIVFTRVAGEMLPLSGGEEPRPGLVELPATSLDATPERPREVPAGATWLSPAEEQAIAALDPVRFMSSDQVATALDVADKRSLCVLLTNLAARGVIESARGQGYRRRKLP